MIRKSIADAANAFAVEVSGLLAHTELGKLDFSWPSVGVLDRLTFWLRGKANLSREDAKLVHCIAAYLGCMAHDIWEESFGGKVIVDQDTNGVFLKLSESRYLNEAEVLCLRIESGLLRLLRDVPQEIPVIASFSRSVPFDYNYFSLFCLGILLGPSPLADGSWAEQSIEFFDKPIENGARKLLATCSRCFSRCYPEDVFGQLLLSEELEFVYPPTLMGESFPVENLVLRILTRWKEKDLPLRDLIETASNFSTFADEKISLAGMVIYFAISEDVSPRVFAQSERLGSNVIILSKSISDAKDFLGKGDSWIVKEKLEAKDLVRLAFERKVGLYPWLKLSTKWIGKNFENKTIRSLLDLLFSGSINDAVSLMERIIENDPSMLEVRLQNLFIEYLAGNNDETILKLKRILTEPHADQLPQLYLLWGLCESRKRNHSEAAKRFKAAHSLCKEGDDFYFEAGLNYLKATAFLGGIEEAIGFLESFEVVNTSPVDFLTTKVALFRAAKVADKAEKSWLELANIAPLEISLIRDLVY